MRGRVILISAVVVVLTSAGVVAGLTLAQRERDPAQVVTSYLDAIARGDGQEATRLSDPGENVRLSLLDGALADAAERIEVGTVETVDRDEDRATVRAEYSLAGETFETDFSVRREESGFLQPENWTLATNIVGTAQVVVHSPAADTGYLPELRVSGEQIVFGYVYGGMSAIDGIRAVSFFGYPAVYDLSVSSSDYFDGAETSLTLKPRGEESEQGEELVLKPSERLVAELLDQGEALAAACVRDRSLLVSDTDPPAHCPRATDLQTARECEAAPGERLVRVEQWMVGCPPEFNVSVFGATVSIERAGEEAKLEPHGAHDYVLFLGPYRFGDDESGDDTVQYLTYADLSWNQGQPVLLGGNFTEEKPDEE